MWLATNLASIECMTLGNLPLDSTWLLSGDESHWTTLAINDARARSEFWGVASRVPWGGVTDMEKRKFWQGG